MWLERGFILTVSSQQIFRWILSRLRSAKLPLCKIMMLPPCYFIKIKKNNNNNFTNTFSASVISDMIPIKQHWYLWSTLLQLTPKPHWKLFFVCHKCASWKYHHSIFMAGQVVLQPSFLLSLQFLLCSYAHLWATDPSSCAKKYPVALSVHVTLQTRVADGSSCARVTRDKKIPFFLRLPPLAKATVKGTASTTQHGTIYPIPKQQLLFTSHPGRSNYTSTVVETLHRALLAEWIGSERGGAQASSCL